MLFMKDTTFDYEPHYENWQKKQEADAWLLVKTFRQNHRGNGLMKSLDRERPYSWRIVVGCRDGAIPFCLFLLSESLIWNSHWCLFKKYSLNHPKSYPFFHLRQKSHDSHSLTSRPYISFILLHKSLKIIISNHVSPQHSMNSKHLWCFLRMVCPQLGQ